MEMLLTIRNILNKIKIDYMTYLLLLIGFLTGLFKSLIYLYIIVIIHELGHLFIAILLSWKIDKIIIYPFGGYIKFNEIIDKPLIEEFLVSIFGLLFQFIYFFIIYLLHEKNIISNDMYLITRKYNFLIFIFNIIPILPLDGYKILNIIFNKIFNYRLSFNISLIISIILLIFFIFFLKLYNSIFLILFIINEHKKYIKNKNYYYNLFLYEKLIYKQNFKSNKYVKSIYNIYRNKNNYIKYNGIYIREYRLLKKRSIASIYNKGKIHNMEDIDNT